MHKGDSKLRMVKLREIGAAHFGVRCAASCRMDATCRVICHKGICHKDFTGVKPMAMNLRTAHTAYD